MEGDVYIRSMTGDDSIPVFLAFVIEHYKRYKGITGEQSATLLSQCNVLDHLVEFYDVLHTQSEQWLMQEVDSMVNRAQNNAANSISRQ